MPYMAVGSRQILFNDTQAPAATQANPPPSPQTQAPPSDTGTQSPVNPAQEVHLGNKIDIRV